MDFVKSKKPGCSVVDLVLISLNPLNTFERIYCRYLLLKLRGLIVQA